uniref:Uncharacterized protein n=1 Tax=Physcomitrium patens TaxID=3218 RepID=A0A2K1IVK4_PHYPA|nr:hypothetical protein PHYPA_025252 [Physcomitrium patens]
MYPGTVAAPEDNEALNIEYAGLADKHLILMSLSLGINLKPETRLEVTQPTRLERTLSFQNSELTGIA